MFNRVRGSLPIPWLFLIIPALLTSVVVFYSAREVLQWKLVLLPMLSGVPRSLVMGVGLIASVAVAVTYSYLGNKNYLSAVEFGTRSKVDLPLRVWGVVSAWVIVPFYLVNTVMVANVAGEARGGTFYVSEFLIAIPMLLSFTALGLLSAVVVRTWFAPVLALTFSLVLIAIPLIVVDGFGPAYNPLGGLDYLLVSGGFRMHGAFNLNIWALVIVGWFLLVGAVVLLASGVLRSVLIQTPRAGVISALGLVVPVLIFGGFLRFSPQLFSSDVAGEVVCQDTSQGVSVCVAEEETAILAEVMEQVELAARKVNPWVLPQPVGTGQALQILKRDGVITEVDESALLSIGIFSQTEILRSIAFYAGGSKNCFDLKREGSEASWWSSTSTLWIEGDTESLRGLGEPYASLMDLPLQEQQAWFQENGHALYNCEYDRTEPLT